MKLSFLIVVSFLLSSCTTIHYRSKGSVPISFEGNPTHQKEVSIRGRKDFYFWGIRPDEQEVFLDDEVKSAGLDGLSKVIVYEHKNPQDTLISFLTLGLYIPKGYTITGFTSGASHSDELDQQLHDQFNNQNADQLNNQFNLENFENTVSIEE